MQLPLFDWQFLAVTAAALFCAGLLLRALARLPRGAGCGGCALRRRGAQRVTLTVQGRRP